MDKPIREMVRIEARMRKSKEPDMKDVEILRRLSVKNPEFLSAYCETISVRRVLLDKVVKDGFNRAFMLAEMDVLKERFEYRNASPLERLLIDHILTARLRVIDAEALYTKIVAHENVSLEIAEYWDRLLSSTQVRLLQAIESLARVRRLARNTPALQINIAREGGKQINVQGDAGATERSKRAASPKKTKSSSPFGGVRKEFGQQTPHSQ